MDVIVFYIIEISLISMVVCISILVFSDIGIRM